MRTIDIRDSVLYYPTIEFQSEAWLKSALCVWDSIYRIVPPGYKPNDSEEVAQAVQFGAIKDLQLTAEDLSQTAGLFEKFWNQVPFVPAGAEGPEEYRSVRLHRDKIDARIRPILESLSSKVNASGWMKLNSRIANTYMLFLSETVSRRRAIPKLTDSSDMFAVIQYFMNDGNFDENIYDTSKNECTTSLVLETILPSGLDSTRMTEVLELTDGLKAEREAFRNSVDEFVQAVARVDDEQRVLALAKKYGQQLASIKEDTKKRIFDLGRKFIQSLLVVGIPSALTALGAFAIGKSSITSLDGVWAGCVGAVATVADANRSQRKDWSSKEAAYYLQLQKNLSGRPGITLSYPRFDYLLNEYVND